MLDQPWIYGISSKKQSRFQPVTNYTHWPVLGSYNNWNIIHLSQKSINFEAFEEIHHVVFDIMSDKMASLVQSYKYGSTNTSDTTTYGYCVIKFISE